MIHNATLRSEETAILALRQLYLSYGYVPYRMSKFEEYEYYIRNKDFLVSDRIISFTDTNGRLLALKPDVTLSIIRNAPDEPGTTYKVCYNENIYRPGSDGQYRELMQTGLECIGCLTTYDLFEVLLLAARSLALIGPESVIQLSHMGILAAAIDSVGGDREFAREVTACIASKNRHDLQRLCQSRGIDQAKTRILTALASISGPRSQVLQQLRQLSIPGAEAAIDQLQALSDLLDTTPESSRILLDFSVVNDMGYYSGIVFRGFLAGISDGVLAGGQYDKLMRKLGRASGAIGFALYLDLLEQLPRKQRQNDVDVLILAGEETDPRQIAAEVARLTAAGCRISVQGAIPQRLRYGKLLDMTKEAQSC